MLQRNPDGRWWGDEPEWYRDYRRFLDTCAVLILSVVGAGLVWLILWSMTSR